MKNILTKIGYMAIGCLLTLIGYHFGNVESNNVSAQQPSESALDIVDNIRVRQLEIVDDDDTTTRVKLSKDGIELYNTRGVIRAAISVRPQDDSGMVLVLGPHSSTGSAARLGVDKNGGSLLLYNNFVSNPVLAAVITDKGEGLIVSSDKAGDIIDDLGSFHTYGAYTDDIPRYRDNKRRILSISKEDFALPAEPKTDKRRIIGGVDVTDQLKQIETGRKPDETLTVGDRFALSDNNVIASPFIYTGTVKVNNIIQKEIVKFQNQNGRSMIILKDGTVYIAPNGCEITDGVITEGQLEVYYKTRNP